MSLYQTIQIVVHSLEISLHLIVLCSFSRSTISIMDVEVGNDDVMSAAYALDIPSSTNNQQSNSLSFPVATSAPVGDTTSMVGDSNMTSSTFQRMVPSLKCMSGHVVCRLPNYSTLDKVYKLSSELFTYCDRCLACETLTNAVDFDDVDGMWYRWNELTKPVKPGDRRKIAKPFTTSVDVAAYAAKTGSMKTLNILLDRGVSFKQQNGAVMMAAIKSGRSDIVRYLIYRGIDMSDDVIAEALTSSARHGNVEVFTELIRGGADVHARDDESLRLAAQYAPIRMVKTVLDAGADVHARGDEALQLAAKHGRRTILRTLLNAGADKSVLSDAIVLCAEAANVFTLKDLLAAGADLHVNDDAPIRLCLRAVVEKGLSFAPAAQQPELGKPIEFMNAVVSTHTTGTLMQLVKAGADVHACNDECICLASEIGHMEILKTLINAGADVHAQSEAPIRIAASSGRYHVLKELLLNGVKIEANDNEAIRLAAQNGFTNCLKLLVDSGGNPRAVDDQALKLAVLNGHADTVKYLIACGCNAHLNDDMLMSVAVDMGVQSVIDVLVKDGGLKAPPAPVVIQRPPIMHAMTMPANLPRAPQIVNPGVRQGQGIYV